MRKKLNKSHPKVASNYWRKRRLVEGMYSPRSHQIVIKPPRTVKDRLSKARYGERITFTLP
jgi:hypothetical protein